MCSNALSEKLIQAKSLGNFQRLLFQCILPVSRVIWRPLRRLSIKYKFKIIEDASHALGASYKGQAIGAGNYSDITVFQFSSSKDDYYWRRWNGAH